MDDPNPIRTLLIGPGGQLGWELLKVLPTIGEGSAVGRGQMDLRRPDEIRARIETTEPDLIINPAAYTDVDRAETEPEIAEAVNAIAPGVIAEAARKVGAAVIHYSTDFVFDGTADRPYTTDDAPAPINVYGRTKLAGEQAVLESGAAAIVLRVSWLYSRRRRNFLLSILEKAQSQDELRVVADRFGCPTWAQTVADATVHIVRHSLAGGRGWRHFDGREGLYHVACEGVTSWHGLARRILDLAKLPRPPKLVPIRGADHAAAAERPTYTALDTRSTRRAFGLALPSWEDALHQAINDPFAADTEPIFLGFRAAS